MPLRRGTGALGELWLRWPGPLGLAVRQVRRPLDRAVRVWLHAVAALIFLMVLVGAKLVWDALI